MKGKQYLMQYLERLVDAFQETEDAGIPCEVVLRIDGDGYAYLGVRNYGPEAERPAAWAAPGIELLGRAMGREPDGSPLGEALESYWTLGEWKK
jgi:hypothetical protein